VTTKSIWTQTLRVARTTAMGLSARRGAAFLAVRSLFFIQMC
jgi:hypothetical protein